MERWTLRESEPVVTSPWLTIERNRYVRDGLDVEDYYVLRRKPFVVIVAVASDDSVLMVREYRAATDQTYLAFPAGYIEPGEDPCDAARRELREETGATASGWRCVGQLDPLPGYIDSRAHVFRCDVVGVDPDARVGEDGAAAPLEVLRLQRSAVRAAIVRGEINEMQAVSAFLVADAAERDAAAE
jgi:ADP-ribose pyrophosphatase